MAKLYVITGPMFSGKGSELSRKLVRLDIAKKHILAVVPRDQGRMGDSPQIEMRVGGGSGRSEITSAWPAFEVGKDCRGRKELERLIKEYAPDVLAIDEVQFFKPWIVDFLQALLAQKNQKNLIIFAAGLDMDAWKEPFKIVATLLAIANERVIKLKAVCSDCGEKAAYTKKIGGTSQREDIGDTDMYQPCCGNCWTPPRQVAKH